MVYGSSMRTTLSIDDDLAQSIEKLRSRKNLSLREVVNQLLRAGIQACQTNPASRPYKGEVPNSSDTSKINTHRSDEFGTYHLNYEKANGHSLSHRENRFRS